MGFPTANILPDSPLPSNLTDGVWAGIVDVAGRSYKSVANIGFSPSVTEGGAHRIEAHIIGFEGNLYGSPISLTLLYHLRGEQRFPSREALCAQIALDRERALQLLEGEC